MFLKAVIWHYGSTDQLIIINEFGQIIEGVENINTVSCFVLSNRFDHLLQKFYLILVSLKKIIYYVEGVQLTKI